MTKAANLRQARIDDENWDALTEIKRECPFKPSITTLVNQAIRDGLDKTRGTFAPSKTNHEKGA